MIALTARIVAAVLCDGAAPSGGAFTDVARHGACAAAGCGSQRASAVCHAAAQHPHTVRLHCGSVQDDGRGRLAGDDAHHLAAQVCVAAALDRLLPQPVHTAPLAGHRACFWRHPCLLPLAAPRTNKDGSQPGTCIRTATNEQEGLTCQRDLLE